MKKRTKIIFIILILIVLLILFSVSISRRYVFDYCVQTGNSMSPAIENTDTFYLSKLAYLTKQPERWDIIAFESPVKNVQTMYIMRIIGLPGDKIESIDNELFINGKKLKYPDKLNYLKLTPGFVKDGDIVYSSQIKYPYIVPQNSYYVRGDNNLLAYDSRSWGAVPKGNIKGKVIIK